MRIGDVVEISFTYGTERALGTVIRIGVITSVEDDFAMVTPVDEYFDSHWVSPTCTNINRTVLEHRPDYLMEIANRIKDRGYVEKAEFLIAQAEKSLNVVLA